MSTNIHVWGGKHLVKMTEILYQTADVNSTSNILENQKFSTPRVFLFTNLHFNLASKL